MDITDRDALYDAMEKHADRRDRPGAGRPREGAVRRRNYSFVSQSSMAVAISSQPSTAIIMCGRPSNSR